MKADRKEIWKEIPGYDGYYEVSNKGRVRSWYSRIGTKVARSKAPKIRKLTMMGHGYYHVSLSLNKSKKYERVSRLVANAFIPNPENKPQVNHIDGNKLNNDVSNLEWVTCIENIMHYVGDDPLQNENILRGEDVNTAKLTSKEVKIIRRVVEKGIISKKELADIFEVHTDTIDSAANYKTWTHV